MQLSLSSSHIFGGMIYDKYLFQRDYSLRKREHSQDARGERGKNKKEGL